MVIHTKEPVFLLLVDATAHTVRNLHFLSKKFHFDFPRKIVELFWVKTHENAAVWDFSAVDNFDFTRKIVKTNLGEKLVKMFGFCQN